MKSFTSVLLASLLSSLAAAQTFTSCNPLNGTCPPDAALGTSHTFNLTSGKAGSVWNATSGNVDYSNPAGGRFTINQQGDSPTIQSEFYIFFGEVHVVMQAAQGQGIISSIVLESDDLDEVDWEITGTNNTLLLGQPTTTVETNYFGKGNTTAYDRAFYYPVEAPTSSFHNYSVVWTADKIDWLIDGNLVRTLPYAAALGGQNFPQTPMTVRIGIWAGGDPNNEKGVIEWAGGKTNYDDGPFTMTVASIHVQDYSQGSKQYVYSDRTGSYQSIKALQGNSTAAVELNKAPAMSVGEKWAALSSGARSGIIAGICALVACLLALFGLAVWKRRRAGRKEAEVAERKFDQDNLDMIQQQQEFKSTHKSVYAESSAAASEDSVAQASNTLYNSRGQPMAPSSPSVSQQYAQPVAQSSPVLAAQQYSRPTQMSYNNPSYNPGLNAGQGGGFRGGLYNNGYGGASAGSAPSVYNVGGGGGGGGAAAQSGYYGGGGAQSGYYGGGGHAGQYAQNNGYGRRY